MIINIIFAATVVVASWWDTPEVRQCCSQADALYADQWEYLQDGSVRAVVTGGGPRDHAWAPIGREYIIPPNKILTLPGNPTGRPMIFISPSVHELVFCFAPGPMI